MRPNFDQSQVSPYLPVFMWDLILKMVKGKPSYWMEMTEKDIPNLRTSV